MTASRFIGSRLDAPAPGREGAVRVERPARARRGGKVVDETEPQAAPARPRRSSPRCRCTSRRAALKSEAGRCRQIREALPQPRVGGDAAGRDQGRSPRRNGARNQAIAFAVRSQSASQIASSTAAARSLWSCRGQRLVFERDPAHRGLQPGKRKVAARSPDERPRQAKAPPVAAPRRALDRRAARIAEPDQLCRLVEGLAGGIVKGRAEPGETADAGAGQQLAMAAGNQQQQIGKGDAIGRAARSAHALRDG